MNEVDWIGELPASWNLSTIGRMANLRAGGTPTSTSGDYWDDAEGTRWLAISDMGDVGAGRDHRGRFLTSAGLFESRLKPSQRDTVLFAMYASVGAVAFLRDPAVGNQAIIGLEPRQQLADARYLYWLMVALRPTLPFHYRSNTQNNLNAEQVRSLVVPQPPLHGQLAIADYLDRETAQIDAFIAKNEELIALLTERRAAVIARAILRGLDPTVELRDTGVPWIGHVPSHWRVSRMSRWFSVTLGKMLDEAKFTDTVGDELPYIRASNIKPERLDLTDVKVMPFTRAESGKFNLQAGDLVVVEGGSIGVNAPIEEDMPGWGFQKTVNRVRPIDCDLTRFLGYQLDVLREVGVLNMITNVSTIQHLTAEKLERIVVAMPPREEQASILAHIESSTSSIDAAMVTAERAIELARERRAALISAAVTGKIDVAAA